MLLVREDRLWFRFCSHSDNGRFDFNQTDLVEILPKINCKFYSYTR